MLTNCASVPKSILLVATIAVWSELCRIEAEVYPSIYWTPHNPIFLNSRNELKVFLDDKIHIVCPNPSTVMTTLKDETSKDNLHENLWEVDEASYKTCSARTAVRRKSVLVCDKPLKLHYVTITFQKYHGSTENVFEPGKEYFFIATSNGTKKSLNSTSSGHCSTHNMKFKVYICRNKQDARCKEKRTTPANEDSEISPSTTASLNKSNQMKRTTPANEDSEISPSTTASLNESNHTKRKIPANEDSEILPSTTAALNKSNHTKRKIPANEDSEVSPSMTASLNESNHTKRKIPANEDSEISPSMTASLNESNHTKCAVSNFSNNSAFGSDKSDADHFQKNNISVVPIAILTTVAALSIGFNAVLLWQRVRDRRQNMRRDSTQLSIKIPS